MASAGSGSCVEVAVPSEEVMQVSIGARTLDLDRSAHRSHDGTDQHVPVPNVTGGLSPNEDGSWLQPGSSFGRPDPESGTIPDGGSGTGSHHASTDDGGPGPLIVLWSGAIHRCCLVDWFIPQPFPIGVGRNGQRVGQIAQNRGCLDAPPVPCSAYVRLHRIQVARPIGDPRSIRVAADSSSGRDKSVESFRWSLPCEGLAWTLVEQGGDGVEVLLGVDR